MVPQSGKPQRKRLGDILVEAGVISGQQLQEALTKQKILGKRLGKVLVDTGITTEDSIATTLAAQMSIPYLNLNEITITPVNNFKGESFVVNVKNSTTSTDISTLLKAKQRNGLLNNVTYTGEAFKLHERYDENNKNIGWDEVCFEGNDEIVLDGIITSENATYEIADYGNPSSKDATNAGKKIITFTMKQGSGYTGSISLDFTIKQEFYGE